MTKLVDRHGSVLNEPDKIKKEIHIPFFWAFSTKRDVEKCEIHNSLEADITLEATLALKNTADENCTPNSGHNHCTENHFVVGGKIY